MSDPALNNQNQSYVDSYVPPTGGNQPSTSQPMTNTKPGNFDPLKKLEELVTEFETKKDEQKSKQLADVENLQQLAENKTKEVVQTAHQQVDPLAELEKALEEYEQKYKQRVAEAKQPQTAPTEGKSASNKVSLTSFEQVLTAEENKVKAEQSTVSESVKVDQPVSKTDSETESIEEQNIFDLLGVSDATEQEKESFLDELQQALWDDFLAKDLALLVSESELAEIEQVKNDTGLAEEKKQAVLIEKIEQFVPDIEEIMLEKALALKEDMLWERLSGIRESFKQGNQDQTRLDEAEQHFKAGRWRSGTKLLNSL